MSWISKVLAFVVGCSYMVGDIKITTNNINPSEYLPGTSWEAWGKGKVPVGVDASKIEFNEVEKTGGAKTHTLTVAQMPPHSHQFRTYYQTATGGNYASGSNGTGNAVQLYTSTEGGNQAHNNLQPYITCYMWKRIA